MKCVFCDKRAVQEHHVIPQQELKRTVKWSWLAQKYPKVSAVTADPRNKVGVCWEDHQLLENKRIYLARDQLPDGIDGFAEELGLGWWLDKFVYSTDRRTA
jgi:hypothetical protein